MQLCSFEISGKSSTFAHSNDDIVIWYLKKNVFYNKKLIDIDKDGDIYYKS